MSEAESNGQIPFKILVIDNNDSVRMQIADALLTKGFDVLGEKNGHMAERAAVSFQPELFIIALDLPRLYGNLLVRKFRTDEQYQKIPIITLAPNVDKRQIAQMQEFSVKDILIKPVEIDKLVKTVEKYYRMKVIVEMSKDD